MPRKTAFTPLPHAAEQNASSPEGARGNRRMTDQSNGLQGIADRHGVSLDAVRHLVRALEGGHGRMAQFNHPDLGGFGQWSSGGMTMIGDMFNAGLKARVDAVCTELAAALPASGWSAPSGAPSGLSSGSSTHRGWPTDWGSPATSGSQNGMRYAFFPAQRRLAIETDGRVALYDTGEHVITGVSQQQGGASSLRFSGRGGAVDLASLKRVDESTSEPVPGAETAAPEPFTPEPFPAPSVEAETAKAQPVPGSSPADEVLNTLERLSDLQRRGVLTEAEFAAKKAQLLARL